MTYKNRRTQARACLAAFGILLLASASCEEGYQPETPGQPPGDTSPATAPPAGTPASTPSTPAGSDGSSTPAPHAGASNAPDGGSTTTTVTTNAASWTQIYTTMLANPAYPSSCAGASCHDPGKSKGVDLSSAATGYLTLRAQVVPGSPDTSRLVLDLQSGRMPEGRPRMPAQDVDVVRAWITAGALDN